MLARIRILEDDSESMKAWRRTVEKSMEVNLENTEISLQNTETLNKIAPILNDLAGAIRTLGWVGKAAKWVATIGGGITAIWVTLRWLAAKFGLTL